MEIKKLESIPEDLEVSYLEVVILPNGELISMGKSLGMYKDYSSNLWARSCDE